MMVRDDSMYVPYLELPRSQRRWLRLAVPALLWGLCAVAALVRLSFPPGGSGTWDTSNTLTQEGWLSLEPYAVLRTSSGEAFILLEAGKRQLRSSASQLDKQYVHVEGYSIARDNRHVLELLPGEEGIAGIDAPTSAQTVNETSHGMVQLQGEIIDYKCYLGAMKPGGGLTHRGCAVLCIQHGTPPALHTRDDSGDHYFILTDTQDEAVESMVLPLVGEPVEVHGEVVERSGFMYMRVEKGSIHRLR